MTLMGCSDAKKGAFFGMGRSRHIQCYSGGSLIYEGDSSGIIENEKHSDGFYFMDNITRKLVEIQADCLIMVK